MNTDVIRRMALNVSDRDNLERAFNRQLKGLKLGSRQEQLIIRYYKAEAIVRKKQAIAYQEKTLPRILDIGFKSFQEFEKYYSGVNNIDNLQKKQSFLLRENETRIKDKGSVSILKYVFKLSVLTILTLLLLNIQIIPSANEKFGLIHYLSADIHN
jgi:hypothetical protein